MIENQKNIFISCTFLKNTRKEDENIYISNNNLDTGWSISHRANEGKKIVSGLIARNIYWITPSNNSNLSYYSYIYILANIQPINITVFLWISCKNFSIFCWWRQLKSQTFVYWFIFYTWAFNTTHLLYLLTQVRRISLKRAALLTFFNDH